VIIPIYNDFVSDPVQFEKNNVVWIGYEAVILSGVRIGDRANCRQHLQHIMNGETDKLCL
jgi:hypothetical protein